MWMGTVLAARLVALIAQTPVFAIYVKKGTIQLELDAALVQKDVKLVRLQ